MQKVVIILGLVLLLTGLAWPWLSTLPIGRLPGDIVVERKNIRIYFPLTTMAILSILVSSLVWLLRK